jgi:hypothetical protein
MKAGVVIGSYNYPRLVELQIKLIRDRCGEDTQILVCDDCSTGTALNPDRDSKFETLFHLCHANRVTLWSNPDRLGHVGGDLVSYYLGLQWAKALDLDVFCKLSQRCLVDVQDWLRTSASGLLSSGLATGCQSCFEGPYRLPLRTEAILFDVARWYRPDTLSMLFPRPIKTIAAEALVWEAMRLIENDFWRWPLFQERRTVKDKGIVWHCSHSRADYESVASRYGVTLDESFTVRGWQAQGNYC